MSSSIVSQKGLFDFLSIYRQEEKSFIVKDKRVSSSLVIQELSQIISLLEEKNIVFVVDEGLNLHVL
ncbi:MAG: hypothetical protein RBQ81_04210 [Arcobacteraceae bacterium]|jgi:hypothetical protein|nr:hypothetical protein [Arcobacteraceae bacterium]MDY0365049.1 hypothetical protein [Arcobacteraceae bacterium]